MLKTSKKICDCLSCELREVAFSNLDQVDIERICDSREEKAFSRGEIINKEGDRVRDFKYLKNGLVKLFRKSVNGDEQIITIARPFEFVSNTNVFSEGYYSYSLSALEDSVACCIKVELIKELIEKNGKFALKLLSVLSRTSERIITIGLEIRSRNLAGRVAYVLLFFAKEIYHSNIFELPVSRKEIADFISMSSANVIRTFSELKRDNIIRSNGRTIEITDLAKLEVISRRG